MAKQMFRKNEVFGGLYLIKKLSKILNILYLKKDMEKKKM